ncbi:MAG: spore germination protein [Firmicutes bacterium]|nr:spore germination protein [Bacillota bacterium]
MLEDGKISNKQLILLVFIFREVVTLTYFPLLTAPPENQDLWISILLSLPFQLALTAPVYYLWTKFPNKTIIQYSQVIIGKTGKLIGLLYICFFIHLTSLLMVQFSYFFVIAVMPETPIAFFLISFMLVCAYAVRNGLEVITRLTEIFVPITITAVIIILIFMLKNMDFKALLPIMENGFSPVFYGGLITASRFVEIMYFAMLLPFLNNFQKIKSTILFTYLLIDINALLITIPIITIFGTVDAKIHLFPFFDAIKLVNIGDFWEHIEVIHMAVWLCGIVVQVSTLYYLAALGIGQLFNLKDYKPLVLPLGTIIVALAILIAPNVLEQFKFLNYRILIWYSLFFILVIPLILVILSLIRRKGENQLWADKKL